MSIYKTGRRPRDAKNRNLSDIEMQALIEGLRGTCDTIEKHLPEGLDAEDMTRQDCEKLDAEIMECDNCGWWVESELINDNGHCDECAQEID